jgi:PKD repeat protein/pimeloyl-ACP methyl ester carboxylesterase
MAKIISLILGNVVPSKNGKASFFRLLSIHSLFYLFVSCATVLGGLPLGQTYAYEGISLPTNMSSEVEAFTTSTAECKEQDGKILIDFEGISNSSYVGDAYRACGVYFSDDALGLIDADEGGSGNFANEPSPNTILFFLDSDRATLNFSAGIVGGFSFYYTAINHPGFIIVYSEENRQGRELAYLELPLTPSLGQGDPTGEYDKWEKIGVEFDGVAKSIDFGGTANHIGFDNITLNSAEAAGTKIDHFQFSDIEDQNEGVFFNITITALDQYGNRALTFNGRADLSTSYGNYVVTENENGAVFVNGKWQGNVKIIRANNDYFLRASCDGSLGTSNMFDVTGDSVVTGRVEGKVWYKNTDTPVHEALVLISGNSTNYETTSSIEGAYLFESVPTGTYEIKASKGDFCSLNDTVKVLPMTSIYRHIYINEDKKPLLIIPGILGSTLKTEPDNKWQPHLTKKRWVSANRLKPYDPLIWGVYKPVGFVLFADEFKEDYDVYYVPYDWRVSLAGASCDKQDTAWYTYLKIELDRILEGSSHKKVDIITHSMGGLLTRAYIQSDLYDNDIDKFVMIGTPNMGSCNTYMIDEGGEPKRVDDELDAGPANTYHRSLKDAYETMEEKKYDDATKKQVKDFVEKKCETLRQIAPTYPFLKYKGENKDPEEAKASVNTWLKALNEMPTKSKMVGVRSDNEPYKILTRLYLLNSKKTAMYINVKRQQGEDGTYPSGVPWDPWFDHIFHTEKTGDGTVIAERAAEPFNSDLKIVKEKEDYGDSHAKMLKSDELKKDVYKFLTGKVRAKVAAEVKETPPAIPATMFSLNIEGDVQPYMLDPKSNASGVNTTTGAVEENIPESKVILLGNLSAIHVDNPLNGEYVVSLKGYAEGEFALYVSYFDNDNEVEVERKAQGFYHGGILSFKININSSFEERATIVYPVSPPAEVAVTNVGGLTHLNWQASDDPELSGYKVYSRTIAQPVFALLGTTSGTSYDTGQSWNADGSETTRYYVVTAYKADGSESFYEYIIENRVYVKADFTADTTSGPPPLEVTFSDCSAGTVTSWQWDFDGDGEIDSTERNPAHTYTEEGDYSVTLSVSGEQGADQTTKTRYISVRNRIPATLKAGWNLISLCLQPENKDITSVLESIFGKYASLWSFQNNSWKVYDPHHPGFSDLSTMDAGWGYWINMTEATTLTVTGDEPSKSVDLIRGWNLVGYPCCEPQPIEDALKSIEGKYISVWAYINGQWRVYDPANPGFSDLITMEPGYGYWIKTKQNCTWTLP